MPDIRGSARIALCAPSDFTASPGTADLIGRFRPPLGAFAVREWKDDSWRHLPFAVSVTVPGSAPCDVVTADVTTWVDEAGEPLGEGGVPALADGEPVTATFCYVLG